MGTNKRCSGDIRVVLLQCGVFLELFALISGQDFTGKLGSVCALDNNKNGSCTQLYNCEEAVEWLNNGQYPKICAFEGPHSLVCCPSAPPLVKETGDVADEKCRDYAKYVYDHEDDPICVDTDEDFIIGGTNADKNEFPHMALLGYEKNGETVWLCGGSLISEWYVLTAAHCLHSTNYGHAKYVRMGITNINDEDHRQDFTVEERVGHPEYAQPSHYNDIALVKLDRPAVFSPYVRPACLYTREVIIKKTAIATGWGQKSHSGQTTPDLQKVVLEIIDENHCNTSYERQIGRKLNHGIDPEIQICAGSSREKRDTCQGDSGGPLQLDNIDGTKETSAIWCTYSIVGVTSFGKPCGILNTPGVYTKVYSHLKWIEEIVWVDD